MLLYGTLRRPIHNLFLLFNPYFDCSNNLVSNYVPSTVPLWQLMFKHIRKVIPYSVGYAF